MARTLSSRAADPPVASITWAQALAWRSERHFLAGSPGGSVADVVRRLGAVQAQVASAAELAIRVRRERSRSGDVARALGSGSILKTWAMRGTLHLMAPEEGAAFLSLMASGRSWERPGWIKYFGLRPRDLETMRDIVRQALDGRALTRDELIAAIAAERSLRHLADGLRSGWGTLLKPLAWQGDLCFGPSQGTRVTFMRPDQASRRWPGLPEPEAAAPIAIVAYLRAYGPTTARQFGRWLASGWFGTRQLHAWFDGMGDRLSSVDVDGEPAFVLAKDLDALVAAPPSRAVRLLPGFDQWVLGPGTDDPHVIPPTHRPAVSRTAGWIAPAVIVGGVVAGTWKLEGQSVTIEAFRRRISRKELAVEVKRLSTLLERDLRLDVTTG